LEVVHIYVFSSFIGGYLYVSFLSLHFACLFHPQSFQKVYRNLAAIVATKPATSGGAVGSNTPLESLWTPLEKCVGYSLKILDIVQRIWAPLKKLFASPGVPSWLQAWLQPLS